MKRKAYKNYRKEKGSYELVTPLEFEKYIYNGDYLSTFKIDNIRYVIEVWTCLDNFNNKKQFKFRKEYEQIHDIINGEMFFNEKSKLNDINYLIDEIEEVEVNKKLYSNFLMDLVNKKDKEKIKKLKKLKGNTIENIIKTCIIKFYTFPNKKTLYHFTMVKKRYPEEFEKIIKFINNN